MCGPVSFLPVLLLMGIWCFHPLGFVNNAAVSTNVQIPLPDLVSNSFEYIPGWGLLESSILIWGDALYHSHSCCTILHPNQRCHHVPYSFSAFSPPLVIFCFLFPSIVAT